jgi:hypothetical protein
MLPIAIGRCANENKCADVLIKKECADDFDSYLKDLLMSLIR